MTAMLTAPLPDADRLDADFEITVLVPPHSDAWNDLIPELPQHAMLLEASIVVYPHRQKAVLTYRGGNQVWRTASQDGADVDPEQPVKVMSVEQHQRKSYQKVPLSPGQAQALLAKAYPLSRRVGVISSVITSSEVDMVRIPESQVEGFLTHTGKRHLRVETHADSTYTRIACSSGFAQGEKATFAAKDLTCKKCRKIVGVDA